MDAKEDAATMPRHGPQPPHARHIPLPIRVAPRPYPSIHIPPEPEAETGPEYLPPQRWSPRKGTPSRQPIRTSPTRQLASESIDRLLSLVEVLVAVAVSATPPAAAASHAGHAAADAASAATPVLGTLEMSSSGGGRQQQQQGEARPRLRWTRQLHARFELAVAQLGGADSKSSSFVVAGPAFSLP
jgi:hypothetical protein